tara:strand:+ start:27793 stop:29469 length:1677 start_codon:yes stop_codon:yes gene_type:complete
MNKFVLTLLLITVPWSIKSQNFNGFALYNSQGSNTTYLIDENQNIAHTWNMNTECNYTVLLKENGNLVRGTKNNGNILGGAAEGGRVQEIAPDGTVVWDYVYSNSDHLSHHDITLIGDNVLLTAWEVKTQSEVYAAGFTGNVGNNGKWPTHFVEIKDDGNGGANIIWEWHIWDHLCQDVDPNKPNYVSNISDHPELIDINMITGGGGGPGGSSGDWFHVNGVDYNEELDQIAFSSRFASEIYIIDHSTTTLEAASHSGGNSGMGGDILYRWGNPSNYGFSAPQIIPNAVHDVRWITNDGRPNSGFLQIFNNSGGGNNQSTIDGIKAPLDTVTGFTYFRNQGQPYDPISYSTRYQCVYSAPGQSASDRMSNGNIFVNASAGQGGSGVMYEVDSNGSIVWGPYNSQSQKGFRYECDYPGIIALEPYMNNINSTSCFNFESWNCDNNYNCTDPGDGSGQYSNLNDCIQECVNVSVLENNKLNDFYPNPTTGVIFFDMIADDFSSIKIINYLGQKILESEYIIRYKGEKIKEINLSSLNDGVYMIYLIDISGNYICKKIIKG